MGKSTIGTQIKTNFFIVIDSKHADLETRNTVISFNELLIISFITLLLYKYIVLVNFRSEV